MSKVQCKETSVKINYATKRGTQLAPRERKKLHIDILKKLCYAGQSNSVTGTYTENTKTKDA